MIKNLLRGVGSAVAVGLVSSYRRLSIQLLKIEGARCYLRGVQMARLSAIGLMRMGLVIGLMVVGALLFHIGLFILLPWSVKAKAILGILLGIGYVAAGWVTLRAAMSEKAWLEKSGVSEMLAEATAQSKRN